MTATADQVLAVRRKVAEPGETTYTDEQIAAFIEAHATLDASGYAPGETGYTDTYNLDLAAAEIWEEKAAAVANQYDFNAAGSSFSRSQMHKQYLEMAEAYRKRTKTGRPLP